MKTKPDNLVLHLWGDVEGVEPTTAAELIEHASEVRKVLFGFRNGRGSIFRYYPQSLVMKLHEVLIVVSQSTAGSRRLTWRERITGRLKP